MLKIYTITWHKDNILKMKVTACEKTYKKTIRELKKRNIRFFVDC